MKADKESHYNMNYAWATLKWFQGKKNSIN